MFRMEKYKYFQTIISTQTTNYSNDFIFLVTYIEKNQNMKRKDLAK